MGDQDGLHTEELARVLYQVLKDNRIEFWNIDYSREVVIMGADLTVNQKKFANEYVIDGNVSRAYKAAELLGKHYGLFTDKINLEGNIPVMIVDDLGSDVGE